MDTEHKNVRIIKNKISKNYARFLVIEEILNLCPHKDYYRSIILMLYEMANTDGKEDEVFADLDKNHKCYQKILYIKNSSDYTYDDLYVIIDKIRNKIIEFMKQTTFSEPSSYGFDGVNYFCEYNKFYLDKINKERMTKLLKKKYHDIADLLILNCILRYGILRYHFTEIFADEIYDSLHNKFGANFEALTSPFNCKLVHTGKDTEYCSLFYDTDKYFGSKGNFFEYDITNLQKKVVFIHSWSFTLSHKVVKYVLKHMNSNIKFIVITGRIPTDFSRGKYFQQLKDSDNCKLFLSLEAPTKSIKYILKKHPINMYFINVQAHPSMKKMIRNSFNFNDDRTAFNMSNEEASLLCIEYNRIRMATQILDLHSNYNLEWRNIIERFVLNLANHKIDNSSDILFKNAAQAPEVYKQLLDELLEKHIEDPQGKITQISNIIKNFINTGCDDVHQKQLFYDSNFNINYDDNLYSLGENYFIKLVDRISLYDSKLNPIVYILRMILRYKSILAGNQHWNFPYQFYKFMNKNYNIKLEGFSSPLNSQLVLLDNNASFCSLFYDTDKYFGSLGDIFSLDVKKYYESYIKTNDKHLSVLLNPPFTNILFQKMIGLVNDWLKRIPYVRFFIGMPYWTNFQPIDDLNNNEHKKYTHIFDKGTFYYEGMINDEHKHIYTTGRSKFILFVIANFDILPHEGNYDNIIKHFDPNYIV